MMMMKHLWLRFEHSGQWQRQPRRPTVGQQPCRESAVSRELIGVFGPRDVPSSVA